MSKKLKTGIEFENELKERVIILRHIDLWDMVYFMDDCLFCHALSFPEFEEKYKPTGRKNIIIKKIFNDKYFESLTND